MRPDAETPLWGGRMGWMAALVLGGGLALAGITTAEAEARDRLAMKVELGDGMHRDRVLDLKEMLAPVLEDEFRRIGGVEPTAVSWDDPGRLRRDGFAYLVRIAFQRIRPAPGGGAEELLIRVQVTALGGPATREVHSEWIGVKVSATIEELGRKAREIVKGFRRAVGMNPIVLIRCFQALDQDLLVTRQLLPFFLLAPLRVGLQSKGQPQVSFGGCEAGGRGPVDEEPDVVIVGVLAKTARGVLVQLLVESGGNSVLAVALTLATPEAVLQAIDQLVKAVLGAWPERL